MTADQRTSLDRAILVPITRPLLPTVAIETKLQLFRELQREYPKNASVAAVLIKTWRQRISLLN